MTTTHRVTPLALIAASLLAGCAAAPAPPPPAAPTAVGTTKGTAASTQIGPSGGTATSDDGRLAVVIPPGALASDTAITIEPITNQAYGGVGLAYRLGPQGQTFSVPVQLVFTYTAEELVGSAPQALLVAVQTADGYWEAVNGATLDDAQQTFTVTTTHFSDYSLCESFNIMPATAIVKVSASLPIRLVWCWQIDPYAPGKNRGFPCSAGYAPVGTGKWSVNGIAGGSSATGTVSGDTAGGMFTAPSTKPTPETVAVSTDVLWTSKGKNQKLVLEAQFTIASSPTHYTGTATFTLPNASGTAYVDDWAQFEDQGDTRRYIPSGHVVVDFHVPDCNTLHQQFLLKTSTPTAPVETLTIYSESNVGFPKHLTFALSGDGTVTLACGTTPPLTNVDYSVASLTSFVVGVCPPTVAPVPYADENELTGTFSCPDTGTDVSWDFLAH